MTNNKTGVSKLCIINADGPFEPTNDAPAAMIEAGPFRSVRIVPTAPRWVGQGNRMFGGNFAYTSDSRFSAAVKEITGADRASRSPSTTVRSLTTGGVSAPPQPKEKANECYSDHRQDRQV